MFDEKSKKYFRKEQKARESQLETALDVLQSVFKKSKGSFADEFSRYQLERNWEKVVGKDLASETRPRKIYKTTLYLSAKSSEAQHHFRFSQDVILRRINEFFGEKKIEHLNFSQKKPSSKKYSEKGQKFIKNFKGQKDV